MSFIRQLERRPDESYRHWEERVAIWWVLVILVSALIVGVGGSWLTDNYKEPIVKNLRGAAKASALRGLGGDR